MDTFEKKLCEGMAALVLLAVLGFYFAVYAGAYYHETINRAIDAQFGLTGTIALHLPLTYKAPAPLVGYSISTTSENVTQLAALEASDPAAYSQWWAEIVSNESLPVQDSQSVPFMYGYLAYLAVLIASFALLMRDKHALLMRDKHG